MVNASSASSGFDMEVLLSGNYLKYILFTLFESGTIPQQVPIESNGDTVLILAPDELDQNRLYDINPDFNPDPFGLGVINSRDDAFSVDIVSEAGNKAGIVIHGRFGLLPNYPLALPIDIIANIFLSADETGGAQENVQLNIEITDIIGDVLNLLPEGTTKDDILQLLQQKINRGIALGFVGQGKSVQRVAMRVFLADDEQLAAIGLYINLRLHAGPELFNFIDDRGDVDAAQNFLPPDHNIAFVIPGNMYQKLGDDIKYRMATLQNICPEKYGYPFSYDGYDGTIRGVSVTPVYINQNSGNVSSPLVPTNQLRITIHVEFELNNLPDPDFYIHITLTPKTDDKGIMDLDIATSVSGPLITIIEILTFSAAIVFQSAVPFFLFILEVAGNMLVDKLANGAVTDKLNDSSFLDALPHKLTIESKRWDPLYVTNHQVVANIVQSTITNDGLVLLGKNLFVGRDFKVDGAGTIRSERRDSNNAITQLEYRANGVRNNIDLLTLQAAATDRMPYDLLAEPSGLEDYIAVLSLDQVADRISNKKILREIMVEPFEADIDKGKIFQLMLLADTEFKEIRSQAHDAIKGEIESSATGAVLQEQAAADITNAGCDLDPGKIQLRYNQLLEERISASLDTRIAQRLDAYLRFDISPAEILMLRAQKILKLVNKYDQKEYQVVKKKNGTIYIRDYRDARLSDNLLSLPRYNSIKA